jgi:hypothetical protein
MRKPTLVNRASNKKSADLDRVFPASRAQPKFLLRDVVRATGESAERGTMTGCDSPRIVRGEVFFENLTRRTFRLAQT